jgi:hypothetical protein
MRSEAVRRALCLAVALVAVVSVAVAQEPAQETSPEMQAMMEAWEKMATPGEPHKMLAKREGEWAVTARFWFSPDAPPQESKGSSVITGIMGSRYLLEKFASQMPDGSPFHGMGIGGFDNLKKKYVAAWIDDMSTGIMLSEGTPDAGGTVITYVGEGPDPMTGGFKLFRAVETTIDDDTRRFETFEKGPDGKEFRSMELLYTRK